MQLIKPDLDNLQTTNPLVEELTPESLITFDEFLHQPYTRARVDIETDVDLGLLSEHLSDIEMIVINFTSFTDGRGFSIARRLRFVNGFKGEILAKGYLIADQYALVIQCGFNGVLTDADHLERQPIEHWHTALNNAPQPYHQDRIEQPAANDDSQVIVSDKIVNRLNRKYAEKSTQELISDVLHSAQFGRSALVSSFGTESAVLLHMVAQADPDTPVLFIDTGMLFQETLEYKDQLVETLGLTNVITLTPDIAEKEKGLADATNIASCCHIRKVAPLEKALINYDSWLSGRKSHQNEHRSNLPLFEASGHQIKINPLAGWRKTDLEEYMNTHQLPKHPLEEKGYASVGCAPCTTPVNAGESSRSGRWRGQDKTECGIHFINGTVVRKKAEQNRVIENPVWDSWAY